MFTPSRRYPVGVAGATGLVGQSTLQLLDKHPWFDVVWLGASDQSGGKRYVEAVSWKVSGWMPEWVRNMVIQPCAPPSECAIVFSALPADVAGEFEKACASAGIAVVSNAKTHRMDPDVPLIIPEVNPEHLGLIPFQRKKRGWSGLIVAGPNCSTAGLVLPIAPIKRLLTEVVVSTYQAVSGAGHGLGGMPSEFEGNVVPFIDGEEEKIKAEMPKILGHFSPATDPVDGKELYARDAAIIVRPMQIHAMCARVAVANGHTEHVLMKFAAPISAEQIRDAWLGFEPPVPLPSLPRKPINFVTAPDGPQPKLDMRKGDGMRVSVGRLRQSGRYDWAFALVVDNLVRGAASVVAIGELLVAKGYV